mgnify:CR=1 FL=1
MDNLKIAILGSTGYTGIELLKILDLQNFLEINRNNNLKEIFLKIFPEFLYLNRLERLKKVYNYSEINRDIVLSALLIDEKDNHEYFIHKYNVSKKLNEKFSVFLSKKIGYDYSYISRIFSSNTGYTIEKYFSMQRIEKTKELIKYDELNLSEIAYKLNYSSVAHLSKQFKQVTGMSPTEFKKQQNSQRKGIDQI